MLSIKLFKTKKKKKLQKIYLRTEQNPYLFIFLLLINYLRIRILIREKKNGRPRTNDTARTRQSLNG